MQARNVSLTNLGRLTSLSFTAPLGPVPNSARSLLKWHLSRMDGLSTVAV